MTKPTHFGAENEPLLLEMVLFNRLNDVTDIHSSKIITLINSGLQTLGEQQESFQSGLNTMW